MTTHWNALLDEESHIIPRHSQTAPPARRQGAPGEAPPRHADLLATIETNEVFLYLSEFVPDYSHCGINE